MRSKKPVTEIEKRAQPAARQDPPCAAETGTLVRFSKNVNTLQQWPVSDPSMKHFECMLACYPAACGFKGSVMNIDKPDRCATAEMFQHHNLCLTQRARTIVKHDEGFGIVFHQSRCEVWMS
ncbi:MAG TPA: hypothetical protein VMW70_12335 [Burkholderiales bacterium]|nr:hypothetical protein [Burkholderiales bacterium]